METKRNLKYFTASGISIPLIIGLAITVAFVIVAFFSTMIGIVGAIVGLFVLVFASGGKANDTDIEFQARELTKNLCEQNSKKFEVYEKSYLKMIKPLDLAGYDFDAPESDKYFKKGADGTPRVNYFAAANIIFSYEKIYVYKKRISLTDEENSLITATAYKYNLLDHAEITEKTYKYDKGEFKYYVFSIVMKDGNKAVELCIDYGADSDKAVENINRAIVIRTEELEKSAAEKAQKLAEFRARVLAGDTGSAKGDE